MIMKSHDEIKKGLECCVEATSDCSACPYHKEGDGDCVDILKRDAFALIRQLQDDNAQLNRCIENMTDKLNAMNDEVAKLQAERDAAVRDVRKWCCTCKHCAKEVREAPCNSCRRNGQGGTEECWEWRGVQKEE